MVDTWTPSYDVSNVEKNEVINKKSEKCISRLKCLHNCSRNAVSYKRKTKKQSKY